MLTTVKQPIGRPLRLNVSKYQIRADQSSIVEPVDINEKVLTTIYATVCDEKLIKNEGVVGRVNRKYYLSYETAYESPVKFGHRDRGSPFQPFNFQPPILNLPAIH